MAISRMNMERQMRNMGGIMGLEDQRQGYFLGKLVKKAKKVVKKVAKSDLGKAALLAAGAYGLGAFGAAPTSGGFLNALRTGGMKNFGLSNLGSGLSRLAFGLEGAKGLAGQGLLGTGGAFSGKRALLTGGALASLAPFFMGGEEEVEDTSVPFGDPLASVEAVREKAREYYTDPTRSALYFMPPKSAVRFGGAFASGGLADIPRGGYDNGGDVMMASNIENDKILESLFEKYLDMGMSPLDAEKAAREEFEKMTTKPDMNRAAAAEGGLMDLGGMEKDYREGGFVPIGAEERADDVPARLSKNEFVFTADAVRNAGGGDIDKGAEVMQNMMDNLEAGGNISEESQGKENPAQEMFDQAQMLESRIV